MKVIAFIMVACLVFLSSISGKAETMQSAVVKTCCHKMEKTMPCKHEQKNGCADGMCNTVLSCGMCGFLKVDPIRANAVAPVLKPLQLATYSVGATSDYSLSMWNPPKV
jgi:hypothetical protein